jgi:hypothetical protein
MVKNDYEHQITKIVGEISHSLLQILFQRLPQGTKKKSRKTKAR